MRIRNILYIALVVTLASELSFAQSKKFDRPAAKPTADTAAKGDSKSEKPETKAGDKKVDISDLENRYWTEKDSQFSVVQNRLYTKAKRFSVTGEFGTVVNDAYTNNFAFGATVHYFFSEREGLGLDIYKVSANDNDVVNRLATSVIGSAPDHNIPQGYLGVNYVWVPIYAKMSLLEKKIIYFDMSLSPGIGITQLKTASWQGSAAFPTFPAIASRDQYALTLAIDLAQQFFISEHLALRLDLKNHIYQEQIYGYMNGTQLNSRVSYSSTVLFGVTYFLDSFQKPTEEGKPK